MGAPGGPPAPSLAACLLAGLALAALTQVGLRDFAERHPRQFVVRRHEGLRPRKTGVQQQSRPVLQSAANFSGGGPDEFEIVVMTSMLREVEAGVVQKVIDERPVASDGNRRTGINHRLVPRPLGQDRSYRGIS